MGKIPTAKEFFNLKAQEKGWEDFHHYLAFDSSHSDFETKLLLEWVKEFTKLHVEKSTSMILNHTRPLLLTNKNGSSTTGKYAGLNNTITLNKEQLKNAYSLENIK
jgi:hypothetical protein